MSNSKDGFFSEAESAAMRGARAFLCGAVFFACALFAVSAQAQTALLPSLSPNAKTVDEGTLDVGNINYRIEGTRSISTDAIKAHVKLKKGEKFDQRFLDQSILSLYKTGLYDLITAKKFVNAEGTLDIDFTIVPKFTIAEVVLKGNKSYSGAKILDQMESYAGAPLSEVTAKRDADKIRKFYVDKGYALAKVNYTINRDAERGVGVLIFDIDEGRDICIQNIRFEGDPHVAEQRGFWSKLYHYIANDDDPEKLDSAKLLSGMKTDTWIPIISHITDNGRLKEDELHADIENLLKIYKNFGYLDVEIDESKIRFDFPDADEPGDMDIVIPIKPNKCYHVGEVKFSGNKLFDSDRLSEFVDYYDLTEGHVFSPDKVDKMLESIRTYYGEYGYIQTQVRAVRRPNVKTGNIDLEIAITESQRFYLESIEIEGNSKTKSEVIIRELALAPGDVFDLKRMKISEERLKNTRFFDEVTISPEPSSIPNRSNMRIAVKEGRTGNFTFGAGFSTVESLVATAEITQGNFDYSHPKNYFQGAGQKFRIRGTIGLKSNQVIVSFEEPWVFNRNLSYGIDLYRTDTGYYSDYYSEMRMGVSNHLLKRLFEIVDARLAYKLELVDIYDVDKRLTQLPDPVMIESRGDIGKRSLSQLSLSFIRDDRDNLLTTTKGTRFELIQDLAGGPLMGQTNLYRLEGRFGWWIPTFETGTQVLSIVGRTGTVVGYGGKDVPYFERYFLGGGYNMRGFKYRKVGPIDPRTKEPYGGKTFGFASAEYSFQLIGPVRFAGFYDIGFVNSGEWDWDASNYNSDVGVGLRIIMMGAPMRIDLGYPLETGKYNDNGIQFNFSFGTVF